MSHNNRLIIKLFFLVAAGFEKSVRFFAAKCFKLVAHAVCFQCALRAPHSETFSCKLRGRRRQNVFFVCHLERQTD